MLDGSLCVQHDLITNEMLRLLWTAISCLVLPMHASVHCVSWFRHRHMHWWRGCAYVDGRWQSDRSCRDFCLYLHVQSVCAHAICLCIPLCHCILSIISPIATESCLGCGVQSFNEKSDGACLTPFHPSIFVFYSFYSINGMLRFQAVSSV